MAEETIPESNNNNNTHSNKEEEEEELRAKVEAWRYILGCTEMGVVKCALELGVGDIMKRNKSPMSAADLSPLVGCSPDPLCRILRFLAHLGVLRESRGGSSSSSSSSPVYSHTALSRRILVKEGEEEGESVAAFVEMESSRVMMGAWQSLSRAVRGRGGGGFQEEMGEDLWKYGEENGELMEVINEAMACDTRGVVRAMVDGCGDVFEGVKRMVDVGGGNGTALRMLLLSFPWIHGVNFDLPHVVASAQHKFGDGGGDGGIVHVGGDMFSSIPEGDAVFIKWILHDWGDEECIKILMNCRKAVDQEGGKVIIVECVIEEEGGDEFKGVALMLDMAMLVHTNNGRERTLMEWDFVIKEAGFSSYTVKRIPHVVQSVIEAFP